MTKDELEKKGDEWARRIEDVVIEMACVTNEDELLVYFAYQKIVDSFMESLTELKEHHTHGTYHVISPIAGE